MMARSQALGWRPLAWRVAAALAGYGLWRWLGLDGLSLGPLLGQPWLPAWAGAALSRVPLSLPSWLALAMAVLAPLTGSLLTAAAFAMTAAALTGARPAAYDAFAAMWPPQVDAPLLAAPALLAYLLACRASRISGGPALARTGAGTTASTPLRASTPRQASAPRRIWWKAGVLASPAVALVLATALTLAVLQVGRQAGVRWATTLQAGPNAVVLVVALIAWLVVLLIRNIVKDVAQMALADPAQGQRVTAGLAAMFWLKQRRAIDNAARVLTSFPGEDPTRRVRAGLDRAVVYLLLAGGVLGTKAWLAATKPEVLASAEAWLVGLAGVAGPAVSAVTDWMRNSLGHLANILLLGGGFGR